MSNPNFTTNGMHQSTREESARERARSSGYEAPPGEPKRKASEQRKNAFNPAGWAVEGALGAWEELRHGDFGLSEDFWTHAQAAQRESLLAARSLVDVLLDKTTDDPVQSQAREQKRARRGTISID